jgi:predicted RNase H-like HicB family nuclease
MIFHVTLEQAEDGWIVAECPALPGCVSQGKDEQEALENIKEAIAAWLWAEDQKAIAGLTPQPGRQTIVVALAVKAFQKAGWEIIGQVGSHVVMSKPGVRVNLSIPQHKELSVGTLRALIRHAGLTVDEFLQFL